MKIVTLNELVLGRFAGTLVFLFASVVALLVIGCANVSILLLARGLARQHELAVRMSIGAGRGRLVRQLLTESVLLSLTGAVLGAILAERGVRAIAAMLPHFSFPHEAAIAVSWPVLAFNAAVAVLTGILFGMSPAWQLSRPQVGVLIQDSSGRHTGGSRARNLHRALIVGQVALTLALMAGAGAATRGFLERLHTPLGFEPDRVVSMNVAFPRTANQEWMERLNAQELVRRTVSAVPGVESASISTTWLPPLGGFTGPVEVQGRAAPVDEQVMLGLVGADEFKVLKIPVVKGRMFDQAEVMRAARVAVVNRAFVDRYFKGVDPIGRRLRSPALRIEQPSLLLAASPEDWFEVVGVARDVLNDGIDRPVRPAVFLPESLVLTPDVSLIVRTSRAPELFSASIKERLRQVVPQAVVTRERTFLWWLETEGWGQQRFVARLFGMFALLALVLSATGLFSVVSYSVTQRTREVGTRMALGAQRRSIIALVFSSTATMLGIGLVLGLGLSTALSGVVASWAGGNAGDPLTLGASAAVMLIAALVACVLPAWRAATLDPVRAMRAE